MLKHIITTKYNKSCDYCISRNIPQGESPLELEDLYESLSNDHTSIMFTGGEPLLHPEINKLIHKAWLAFFYVSITTQSPDIALLPLELLDSINFTLHNIEDKVKLKDIIQSIRDHEDTEWQKANPIPIYISIIADKYTSTLPKYLKDIGASGLTINEEQRGEIVTDMNAIERSLPYIKDFSFKLNRKGHCLNETIILPDLTVINNFDKYL